MSPPCFSPCNPPLLPSDLSPNEDDLYPLPDTTTLHAARWLSLGGVAQLERHGSKPWVAGRVGLESSRLLEWARYIGEGGTILPLHFLALPADPVFHEKSGAVSAAQQRELKRRRKPQQATANRASASAAAPTPLPLAQPQSHRQTRQEPQQTAAAAAAKPSAATVTAATAATANAAAAADSLSVASPPTAPPPKVSKKNRSVSFSDESEYTEHDMYTHDEYARRMDPGEGFSDLHELVSYNQEKMESEQEEEVEASIATKRLRAFYILRQGAGDWGMSFAGKKHIGEQVLTEDVLIDQIQPDGAIARDGNLREGDRIIKINGQWALSKQSVVYLMEVLATHDALDVTITRGEPLPPPVDLAAYDDAMLQDEAFEHYGLRIIVSDVEVGEHVWTRADTIALLRSRFSGEAATTPPAAAAAATTSAAVGEEATPSTPSATAATPASGKRRVHFNTAEPTTEETYSAKEYERKLDPGDGFSDLRQLFDHNNQVMEDEQQKEAEAFAEHRRMHTHTIRRSPNQPDFGFKIQPMLRDVTGDTLFLEGVAISDVTSGGAVARQGSIRTGDRLVKINGQWILNHQHADFLLYELLGRANALDLTIIRGDEPLPPVPGDFVSMTDDDLEELALAHAGRRVKLASGKVSRGDLIKLLRSRFAASTGHDSAMAMDGGGAGDDDDDEDC